MGADATYKWDRENFEDFVDSYSDIAESDEGRILQKISKNRIKKKSSEQNWRIVWIIVLALLAWITSNIATTESMYNKTMSWWSISQGQPKGAFAFTPSDAVIAANFPL